MKDDTVRRKRKIFAVGDIHGCLDKLVKLMDRLPVDPRKDLLIFLGDYIDRGPDSRGVIEYLLDLRGRMSNTLFLLGNHEFALLQYAATQDIEYLRLLRAMIVEPTLESYANSPVAALGDLSFLPRSHRQFLEGLLPFYEEGDYFFTHAGIVPGEDPRETPLDRLLFVRDPFLRSRRPSGPIVVFGHTPFQTPLVAPDKIGIDTGAVYGNLLTAVELPTFRFYHA